MTDYLENVCYKDTIPFIPPVTCGKVIKVYDFYEFLLKGKADSDIRLQDGDVVFVPSMSDEL